MSVYVNNITINTGEYFSRDFYLDNVDGTPLNLVGYAGSSYIRKHPDSLSTTATFNLGFVDRANGRIRVSLASTITKEIKPGRYVYDVLFDYQGSASNEGVWTTLQATNSGSYRGYTDASWSSFMNTYAYSRVPQSGNLSNVSEPFGIKTDTYTVNFPYDGQYRIDAAVDNVGEVILNGVSYTPAALNSNNVAVGTTTLVAGNKTLILKQQNTNNGGTTFAQNPVGLAVSITYLGGSTVGKKSIVIEGNILATEDISTGCEFVKTVYTYSQVGVIPEGGTDASSQITVNEISNYGVVHMGVNFNECSKFPSGGSSPTRNLLDNSATRQQILDYIQLGGVVWLNVEWWNNSGAGDGCSNKVNINSMLTLLGTEIRAANDVGFVGNAIRSSEYSVVNSGFPATQTNNASVIFSGGTTVYLGGADRITVYEKIGNGIFYVSGDSNTFTGPSYPSTYYNALRALVLNT